MSMRIRFTTSPSNRTGLSKADNGTAICAKRRRVGLAPYPLIWWVSLTPLSMQQIRASSRRPVRPCVCLDVPAWAEKSPTVRTYVAEITSICIS